MLSTSDHRRDAADLRYIYPVISRRAGGVSLGINLNVNQACNWACLYCQVEGLQRGGPEPVDLAWLERELDGFLNALLHGDFMQRHVPAEARRLVDIAFSGDGEPTSAPEFAEAVRLVHRLMQQHSLPEHVCLRLITNGSLLHRQAAQAGVRAIGAAGGEIWFKLDRVGAAATRQVNGAACSPKHVARRLETCASLASTWVQTCWFGLDGQAPDAQALDDYCRFLAQHGRQLAGVHLYGLARPSMQPAAPRLHRLSAAELHAVGAQIQAHTGLEVRVNP